MSMEEILQLKEKLGSKLYNKAISNTNNGNEGNVISRRKGILINRVPINWQIP